MSEAERFLRAVKHLAAIHAEVRRPFVGTLDFTFREDISDAEAAAFAGLVHEVAGEAVRVKVQGKSCPALPTRRCP